MYVYIYQPIIDASATVEQFSLFRNKFIIRNNIHIARYKNFTFILSGLHKRKLLQINESDLKTKLSYL